MPGYKIMSVDKDGNPLSAGELFDAWVVMARDLAKTLPHSPSRDLCQAVYESVEADKVLAGVVLS